MAVPGERKNKNSESLSPQLFQSFWSKLKDKIPKIVLVPTTVTTKNSKQKEVIWQQYRLCLATAEYQICGGKHVLILAPDSGKIWWLKKVQYFQKKSLSLDSLAWRNAQVDLFIIWAVYFTHLNLCQSHASMLYQQNGKSEQFLETARPGQGFFQSKRYSIANIH